MPGTQKDLFHFNDGTAYLNCAYMSPMAPQVEAAGMEGMMRKRHPQHIGRDGFFEGTEKLKQAFASLIGCAEPGRIALVPSVSYGMANVAGNLRLEKGQRIVMAAGQFPSNVYPWQQLAAAKGAEAVFVSPPAGNPANRAETWNRRMLEAITPNTALVALGHVHWADGTRFDLEKIRERTRDVGALLVVDGTQSVGALPFSTALFQPDALVCAGYKWLFGPYSIGLAYYGEAFDHGLPVEQNWINRYNSEDFAGLVNYEDRYQPLAQRYSVGEQSNFILVPMMQAALGLVAGWGADHIQEYCAALVAPYTHALQELGFGIEHPDWRGSHLFGVRLPAHANQNKLVDALARNKVFVSFRGDSVRISPHLYNTTGDMEKLMDSFVSALP